MTSRATLAALVGLAAAAVGADAAWVDITPPSLTVAPARIGMDPDDPDRLFVGSWGDGLFVSPDGGVTWAQEYSDFFIAEGIASTIVIQALVSGEPANAGVAVTVSGTYYSTNDGGSWERHPANDVGDSPTIGFMIARIPDGSGVVASETATGIVGGTLWHFDWSSLDWTIGNASLVNVNGASTLGLAFDVSDPPILTIGNTFRCFWTDDLGATLNNNSLGLSDNWMRAVVADPEIPGRAIAAVNGGLYRATTPGGGWTPVGGTLPGPILSLIHQPGSPDAMFAATPAGVYRSDDRGDSWTPMTTEGMTATSVTDVAIHPDAPNVLYATASDGTPSAGGVYSMDLEAVVSVDAGAVPPAGRLTSRPSPFRSRTTVTYTLERPGDVRLGVFDAAGRRVARLVDRADGAGAHIVSWDGRDDAGRPLASGVYYVRLIVNGDDVEQRAVTVLR